MKRLLFPLLVILLIPSSANAFISSSALKQLLKGGTRGAIKNTSVDNNESKYNSSSTNLLGWGLTEEQKEICRYRASRENTDFSAKQAYNYCKKNIKAEFKEQEKKRLEYLKNHKGCDEERNNARKNAYDQYDLHQMTILSLCERELEEKRELRLDLRK